jgi:hypothetical protein
MAGLVFILGAGASSEAGAPLMKDFVNETHTTMPEHHPAPCRLPNVDLVVCESLLRRAGSEHASTVTYRGRRRLFNIATSGNYFGQSVWMCAMATATTLGCRLRGAVVRLGA